ncbi:Kalirin [Manis pentadactyla]|nr:Kalirin [Manis pentadactyla]
MEPIHCRQPAGPLTWKPRHCSDRKPSSPALSRRLLLGSPQPVPTELPPQASSLPPALPPLPRTGFSTALYCTQPQAILCQGGWAALERAWEGLGRAGEAKAHGLRGRAWTASAAASAPDRRGAGEHGNGRERARRPLGRVVGCPPAQAQSGLAAAAAFVLPAGGTAFRGTGCSHKKSEEEGVTAGLLTARALGDGSAAWPVDLETRPKTKVSAPGKT